MAINHNVNWGLNTGTKGQAGEGWGRPGTQKLKQ